ncbi:MAG: hypothetical protein KME20_27620 [Kaiparowitsia implicata GSE-PSE-MK54-09C]|jgi:hypothetical protein|nr:hypothetical protein [Kaiparowitsia implicata GSE-PSE-MK54-09C]
MQKTNGQKGSIGCIALTTCLLLISLPAKAQGLLADDSYENLFVMAGPFSTEQFGGTLEFWDNQYESNAFLGAGYQRMLYAHQGGAKFGVEAGFGLRLGVRSSAEVWAGGVARFDMFRLGDFSITPALTAGFSVVTDTIGSETERADALGIKAPFLYYLGPEIAVGHRAIPNIEVLARIHHRSGGFGTIAPLDGSNAAVVGVRHKY